MNSNSLLTTVLRNFQCALRNLGYWPTIYMILEATTALLSFPRFISTKPRSSLMTVTKNRFSVSSSTRSQLLQRHFISFLLIAPDIDPMAQHSVFKLFHDHSEPSICFPNFSVKIDSVSATSRCVK
jgi:hypothetical protein